jgi:hypothetical protein
MAQQLTKVDKARIKLWTAHDMSFVISREKGIGTIPKFTPCEKISYDLKIKAYLDHMEAKSDWRPSSNPKAVCVKLMGVIRYVWRTDVLTEAEYDEVKRKERSKAVGVLGSKSKRNVGQGGAD